MLNDRYVLLKTTSLEVKNNHTNLNYYTKADRILKRRDFINLSRYGKKLSNSQFLVIYYPNELERSRVGITITKKIGNAVIRNRIKRCCREYFRLNKHTVTGNWDINIIAKNGVANLISNRLFLSLQNIFKKISQSVDH